MPNRSPTDLILPCVLAQRRITRAPIGDQGGKPLLTLTLDTFPSMSPLGVLRIKLITPQLHADPTTTRSAIKAR